MAGWVSRAVGDGGPEKGRRTYHVCLAVNLPDAPFAFVLHYLLDHLLPDAAALAPALLSGWAGRYPDSPLSLGMCVNLLARDHTPSLAPADMLPPCDQLVRVFEAARANVEPVQHRWMVVPVSPTMCFASICVVSALVGVVCRRRSVAVALQILPALGAIARIIS